LSNSSKRFILAIVIVLGFSLMIVLGPVIRCAYKHYRFESYIRVLVELPSCEDPISGATGRSCRYLFSFEGERNPSAIQFAGSELQHTYDASAGAYSVTGVGLVTHNRNRVRIDHVHILFDDQELPLGAARSPSARWCVRTADLSADFVSRGGRLLLARLPRQILQPTNW
jgi:hypothetical protein